MLAKRAERIANGGEVKKGRPAVAGSKRQAVIEARKAKIAAGVDLKKGRPAKIETSVEA